MARQEADGEAVVAVLSADDPDLSYAVPSGLSFEEPSAALWDGDVFQLTLTNGDAATLDVDDTGAINASDSVFLGNYLFGAGEPIPPPFPRPGVDPTPDGLACDPES